MHTGHPRAHLQMHTYTLRTHLGKHTRARVHLNVNVANNMYLQRLTPIMIGIQTLLHTYIHAHTCLSTCVYAIRKIDMQGRTHYGMFTGVIKRFLQRGREHDLIEFDSLPSPFVTF